VLAAEERVELLLRTYEEARVSYGVGSTGQGVRLMPSMWHEGSYSELERSLLALRESARRPLWWHACQRFRWGTEHVVVLPVKRNRLGAEFLLPRDCNFEVIAGGPAVGSKHAVARIYRWTEAVDVGKAIEGVAALTALMFGGRSDRIQLPQLILRRRLGLPIEGERELVA
jgi:hypothetical protein